MKRFRALTLAAPFVSIAAIKLWPLIDRIAHVFGVCLGG